MATEDQCSACGERNPPGSAFCVFCQTYLGWEQPGQGPKGTPPVPASTAPPPPGGNTAGGPPPYTPSPTPSPPQAPPPTGAPVSSTAAGAPCSSCGTANPLNRRFCGRCGQPLAAIAPPPSPRTTSAQTRGWWNSEQRAAKREYRRSLPAFYRWRRVILGLLAVAVVVVVASVMGRDPVGWVTDRWYDLRGTTQPVAGVEAVARAPGSSKLVPVPEVTDPDPATVWQRPWVAGSDPTTSCTEAERQGYVELRWEPPLRVRMLQVDAGLAEDENDRDLEFRPETILVSYRSAPQDRACRKFTIPDTAVRRSLELDTEGDVNRLRVSIGSVYDSTTPDEDDPASIRRLIVLSRPE